MLSADSLCSVGTHARTWFDLLAVDAIDMLCSTSLALGCVNPYRYAAMEVSMPLFFVFAVAPLLSAAAADGVPPERILTVEFRWIEPRFVEGVTEKQSRSISPCDSGGWYLHRTPALTTEDFADASLETTLVAGGGVVGRQYYVRYKLKDSAIDKLVKQCGEDSRKRIVAVYVAYQGEDTAILPSPIKYFPATTFDKRQPKAFHPPIIGYTPSKELASQILQASRKIMQDAGPN